MSSAMISDHIPDIDLITACAERQDSAFSRTSPWTKGVLLVLLVLLITISSNLWVLAATYAIILAACAAAALPLRKIAAWYTMPVIFVLSLVGLLAWTQPGTPVFTLPVAGYVLTLTDQGLLLVAVLLVKALIVVTYSLLFLMTTKYAQFSALISRVFPTPLDQIFLLSYRFLFLTMAMTASMLKAVRSRGGGVIRSARMQGHLVAEVFGLVFIRSFEQAERVEKAMTARGYNGTYAASTPLKRPGLPEYTVIGIAILAVAAVALAAPHTGGW